MEVIITTDEEIGLRAARIVADVVRARGPRAVLGVATGSSPLTTYAELARMVAAGELDFSHASAFALDEYGGLGPDDPRSYAATIREEVTVPLGFDPERVHVPDGAAADLFVAAEEYDVAIREAGGVDVQLLGVGTNGHIGFNEPTSSLASRTRVKVLTEQTRLDNSRFFDHLDDVPTLCLTQGLGTIMEARSVVVLATGESKAEAIAGIVEGPVTAMCPGSILQWHPRTTVIVDEAAASRLRNVDYYRYVQQQLDRMRAERP
ncbi:MAG: glucosamine-6-phosphate deaminase [Microbacteriaceae bacterium]|nr:glucosamine-6-phosphate deaminase [Microbacteriaceae bacterium]